METHRDMTLWMEIDVCGSGEEFWWFHNWTQTITSIPAAEGVIQFSTLLYDGIHHGGDQTST